MTYQHPGIWSAKFFMTSRFNATNIQFVDFCILILKFLQFSRIVILHRKDLLLNKVQGEHKVFP